MEWKVHLSYRELRQVNIVMEMDLKVLQSINIVMTTGLKPALFQSDLNYTYQRVQLPHTRLMAWFQPNTATGKLKAVMIPTKPRGFHCSIRAWPGPM